MSGHVVEDLRCNLPLLQWLVSGNADGTKNIRTMDVP